MSGLHYAFIPDRVDSSALMHRQTHSLGKPPRRSPSPPPPPPPLFALSSSSSSAIFTFPSATHFLSLHVCSFHPRRLLLRRELDSPHVCHTLPPHPTPLFFFFFKRGKTALVSVGCNMEPSHQYGNVSNLRDNPAVLSFNFFCCSHLVSILEAALFSQILRLLQQNWQLLTSIMALNTTVTFSNTRVSHPLEP